MSHKLHKFSQILLRILVFFVNPFSCLFFAERACCVTTWEDKKRDATYIASLLYYGMKINFYCLRRRINAYTPASITMNGIASETGTLV